MNLSNLDWEDLQKTRSAIGGIFFTIFFSGAVSMKSDIGDTLMGKEGRDQQEEGQVNRKWPIFPQRGSLQKVLSVMLG